MPELEQLETRSKEALKGAARLAKSMKQRNERIRELEAAKEDSEEVNIDVGEMLKYARSLSEQGAKRRTIKRKVKRKYKAVPEKLIKAIFG